MPAPGAAQRERRGGVLSRSPPLETLDWGPGIMGREWGSPAGRLDSLSLFARAGPAKSSHLDV